MSQNYCQRMYLLSERQYKEYYDLKSKFDNTTESSETNTVTQEPTVVNQDQQSIIDKIPSNSASNLEETPPTSNLETGAGLNDGRDIELKKRNSDFIRTQILQKFLEDKNWKYLYEKIFPLMKTNAELQKNANKVQNVVNSNTTYAPRQDDNDDDDSDDIYFWDSLRPYTSQSNVTPDSRSNQISSEVLFPSTSNQTSEVLFPSTSNQTPSGQSKSKSAVKHLSDTPIYMKDPRSKSTPDVLDHVERRRSRKFRPEFVEAAENFSTSTSTSTPRYEGSIPKLIDTPSPIKKKNVGTTPQKKPTKKVRLDIVLDKSKEKQKRKQKNSKRRQPSPAESDDSSTPHRGQGIFKWSNF